MSKKYLLLLCFVFLLLTLIFPKNSFAANINILNYPATISETENFNVEVAISGGADATNYLRIDLFKVGTTNYFGETFSGSIWYGGSVGTNYLPIQIVDSTASAVIQGRLGTPSLTDYPSIGNYKLRIRRYTSSGNPASGDTQTPVDIQIISDQQTPTPSPTPTAIPNPSPSPVSTIQPTFEPTATPTPKPTPTITPPSPTPLRTSAPQEHGDRDSDHEIRLPFKFKCKIEKHEFKFKNHHFKYFKVSFHRR